MLHSFLAKKKAESTKLPRRINNRVDDRSSKTSPVQAALRIVWSVSCGKHATLSTCICVRRQHARVFVVQERACLSPMQIAVAVQCCHRCCHARCTRMMSKKPPVPASVLDIDQPLAVMRICMISLRHPFSAPAV